MKILVQNIPTFAVVVVVVYKTVLVYYRYRCLVWSTSEGAVLRGKRNSRRAGKPGIHLRGARPSTSAVPPVEPWLTRTRLTCSQHEPAPWSLFDGPNRGVILDSIDMYMHTCVCMYLYLYVYICACISFGQPDQYSSSMHAHIVFWFRQAFVPSRRALMGVSPATA